MEQRTAIPPGASDEFGQRLSYLKSDIIAQGRRVQSILEDAIRAVVAADADAARRVIDQDEAIDRVDVELEKASVQLLTDATKRGAAMPPDQLRMVLTIVKVNNELERIADVGVAIAEEVRRVVSARAAVPDTFQVLANSVVGILRDVNRSFERADPELARVALMSEDAVLEFRRALARETQERVVRAELTVDQALRLHEIATLCAVAADHATNIAEQVIYVCTGRIVRHMQGHWEEVVLPG